MARGGLAGVTVILLPVLGGCVPPQGTPGVAAPPPIFAIFCPGAAGAAGAGTTMVPARAITVTPRPPGAELSWAAASDAAEPGRIAIPPGQHCMIYRSF